MPVMLGDIRQAATPQNGPMNAIHHDFYEGDAEVIVVDEWDSPESFQGFFEAEGENIGRLMAAAGAAGEPAPPLFYRKMSLGDEF